MAGKKGKAEKETGDGVVVVETTQVVAEKELPMELPAEEVEEPATEEPPTTAPAAQLVTEEVPETEPESKFKTDEAAAPAGVQPEFEGTRKRGGGTGWLVVGVVVLLVAGAAAWGLGWWKKSGGGLPFDKPVPSPTPMASPEPSPTPEASPADYRVEVVNGSGIKGEAGRAKKLLEGAGFTVSKTGNADSYDYEETEIQTKAGVPAAIVDKLRNELEKTYVVASGSGELDEEEEADVVVIVGNGKAESE